MAQVRTRRFPLMLTPEEAQAIEGYRWKNQIATMATATRQLIEKGLTAEAEKAEGASAPTPAPSSTN